MSKFTAGLIAVCLITLGLTAAAILDTKSRNDASMVAPPNIAEGALVGLSYNYSGGAQVTTLYFEGQEPLTVAGAVQLEVGHWYRIGYSKSSGGWVLRSIVERRS